MTHFAPVQKKELFAMVKVNQNYLKLPGSYLFSEVARRIAAHSAAHPEAKIIKLSIGDVTRPLVPAVVEAMHKAVDEQGTYEGFHGYGPEQGYPFLREAIAQFDYQKRGVDIQPQEIFISDGAKSDCGNIGDIFDVDNVVAVCDPVYPVYVDTNAMAGRAGDFVPELGRWSRLVYMPCVESNGFMPEPPKEKVDIIYLCFPNNPTGSMATREQLKQLDRYAQALGLAFQVRDDMLDVISSDQELGKPVGSDRANEKSTFVNALGLENCAQLVEELSQQAAEALVAFEQPEFLVWLAHALADRKQ